MLNRGKRKNLLAGKKIWPLKIILKCILWTVFGYNYYKMTKKFFLWEINSSYTNTPFLYQLICSGDMKAEQWLNSFQVNFPILYPQKTPECVFRRYIKRKNWLLAQLNISFKANLFLDYVQFYMPENNDAFQW